ncbi:hypothetical protein [uncultured Winogradskyella sp.]|uniref:hypothetical protein n=1 Tax=uncultured Winogradskyella sp. TaxID=395353 RepID=UPI0026200A77|nr:hypothetical protein [uncultured Winogradskyella sp.]
MKNLLNLGKALNKAEQKQVIGGASFTHECGDVFSGPCCFDVMEYFPNQNAGGDECEVGSSNCGVWGKVKVCY